MRGLKRGRPAELQRCPCRDCFPHARWVQARIALAHVSLKGRHQDAPAPRGPRVHGRDSATGGGVGGGGDAAGGGDGGEDGGSGGEGWGGSDPGDREDDAAGYSAGGEGSQGGGGGDEEGGGDPVAVEPASGLPLYDAAAEAELNFGGARDAPASACAHDGAGGRARALCPKP